MIYDYYELGHMVCVARLFRTSNDLVPTVVRLVPGLSWSEEMFRSIRRAMIQDYSCLVSYIRISYAM